ncbi:MAG: hypothetical protein JWP04_544 [Belnapia sp.]|nr:hypothetical protein [Belnapia sp.]
MRLPMSQARGAAAAAPQAPGWPEIAGSGGRARRLARSLRWLLIAAVSLPVAITAAGGWLAWDAVWREARIDLARQADASAEYASRVLLTYSLATGRLNDLLRGLTDAEITVREAELHAAAKALVSDLPQASAAYVVDRDGVPLLAADRLPVPRIPAAADRDAFAALRRPDAPPIHISQVHHHDGRAFFAISRRRSGSGNPPASGDFDGLVNISVESALLAERLARLMASPEGAVALIRADGTMLVRSNRPDGPYPVLPPDGAFRRLAGAGVEQATYETADPVLRGVSHLVTLRRLETLPVYAAAILPRDVIVAAWWRLMLPQLAIGLPAMLALVCLALLVRRGQLDLITANTGLEAQFAERTAALAELSGALDLTPCMITDLDGRILHWSAGCVRLYGFSPEEALGQPVSRLLTTEFSPGEREALLASLLSLGQWQGELRQSRRDGSRLVTGTQWTLRRDPLTGAPNSIVSTRTDLSALRRAERALSRSEARLRRAQEASGAVAFEVDEHGQVAADAALPGLLGLDGAARDGVPRDEPPRDIEGYVALLPPASRAAIGTLRRRLARAGGTFSLEFRVTGLAGGTRWLLARGEATETAPACLTEPSADRADGFEAERADGSTARHWLVAGIILDVTERRAAEAALAESGERLRLAQGAAEFGIFDYDFPSGATTWDTRMRQFWGLPEELEVTNRIFLAGLHPDDRQLRREAIRRAMDPAGNGAYQLEYRVIGMLDGQERWVSTTGQVHFAAGQPVRLTGLALDITARKRTEQRNELLMREVDHRAKNALAVVQAALRLSRAESPAELVRIVEGRVAALARAQTILARRRWEGAELRDLLEGELAPFLTGIRRNAPRAELAGPVVTVAAHAAQPLCMAIHELATNALKYGALSHAGGLLQVDWQLDAANRMLVLRWRETGGPALAGLPRDRGFGSRVIEQTVQGQLGGRLQRRWLTNGLACDIEIPLSWTGPGQVVVLDGEAAAA